MAKCTQDFFLWERAEYALPAYYQQALPYDGHARSHISFRHGEFTPKNEKIAHARIWNEFKRYCRKCMKKIPDFKQVRGVSYGSSHGFPVVRLPDNSEIITINLLGEDNIIYFVWIVEDGDEYEQE